MHDVYLKPGEYLIGKRNIRSVSTILGSCVSVILWHETSQEFCMCHYLLSGSESQRQRIGGRYGVWVLNRFLRWVHERNLPDQEYIISVIGGAGSDKSETLSPRFRVGNLNYTLALGFAGMNGFREGVVDVGGSCGRKVQFIPHTGKVSIALLNDG